MGIHLFSVEGDLRQLSPEQPATGETLRVQGFTAETLTIGEALFLLVGMCHCSGAHPDFAKTVMDREWAEGKQAFATLGYYDLTVTCVGEEEEE